MNRTSAVTLQNAEARTCDDRTTYFVNAARASLSKERTMRAREF